MLSKKIKNIVLTSLKKEKRWKKQKKYMQNYIKYLLQVVSDNLGNEFELKKPKFLIE